MKRVRTKSLLSAASLAVFLGSGRMAHAAILYQDIYNTTPGHGASKLVSSVAGDGGNGLQGFGDDYNAGAPFTLTGLSFYGGSSATGVGADINFYDSSGNLVTTVVASSSEVDGATSLRTLSPSDPGFGVTLPSSGYFIFAPFDFTSTTASMVLGFSDAVPTYGSSLSTEEATDDNGNLYTVTVGEFSPYAYAKGLFGSPDYAAVELDGTAIPEPASLGLIATGGLVLLRRRRTA